ncbi:hypothetical protein LZ31DRAFT_198616 [Colletotrichum somersetense]|nr:hypothetical protein LZ31DRAFT_198616 [Colletotrichum somersetense]
MPRIMGIVFKPGLPRACPSPSEHAPAYQGFELRRAVCHSITELAGAKRPNLGSRSTRGRLEGACCGAVSWSVRRTRIHGP